MICNLGCVNTFGSLKTKFDISYKCRGVSPDLFVRLDNCILLYFEELGFRIFSLC